MENPEPNSPWNNTSEFQANQDQSPMSPRITLTEPSSNSKKNNVGIGSITWKPWKKIIQIISLIIFIIGIFALGTYGFSIYEKKFKFIPILSLLPTDPNLVLSVTINPDAEQFKLLESNLQKFPGYKILQKKIDKIGEGKTVSQMVQDKIKNYNLDFQQDLRPVLNDRAYIIIDNLSPLGTELQKSTLLTLRDKFNSSLSGDSHPGDFIAMNNPATPSVLGVTKINDGKSFDFQSLSSKIDFIAATEIKDLKKAQEVLKKIQNNSKYTIIKHSYNSYDYFEITLKSSSSDPTIYSKLYNAIIGKNWIVASKDDDLKSAIDKARENSTFNKLIKTKKTLSLAENQEFKKISESLNGNISKNEFISSYIKLNFNEFFKKNDCVNASETECMNVTEFLKYPDDFIMGIDLRSNNDGIGITIISNQQNLNGVKNIPFADGLVKNIPEQVDGKWTDVFVEYANAKDIYYKFKKNNLTDKGLQQLEESLAPINTALNINIESDIIDQINGNIGMMLFTKENTEPEGVIIIPVKDSMQAYATIEKISEALKTQLLTIYSSLIKYAEESKDPYALNYKKQLNKKISDLSAAKIYSTETPEGKIYSFKIPNSPLSFDFSTENNRLIFASHYAAAQLILKSTSAPQTKPLAKNQLYIRSQSYSPTDGYAQSFIVTQGAINAISYIVHSAASALTETIALPTKNIPAENSTIQPTDDTFYALSAIARTMKFIRTSQTIAEDSLRSSIFLDIKEIPAEEKQRAESVLRENQNKPNPQTTKPNPLKGLDF